jgi:hypothetical protein
LAETEVLLIAVLVPAGVAQTNTVSAPDQVSSIMLLKPAGA